MIVPSRTVNYYNSCHNYPSYWLLAKRCRFAEVGLIATKSPTEIHPQILTKPLVIRLIVLIDPLPDEGGHADVLALVRDGVGFRHPKRYFEKVEHAL